ncbi:KTSC domain-containing protein (plasmid) [Novosphingobium sp. BL-8A]|uniref:KTSC domain-containing protein n=1 Tax=Novosphingobium sp. BL-8A TaxID=3127639 RepID=UPI003756D54D
MRTHHFRQSSTIERIAYDEERRELWITFHEAGRYVYTEVPPEAFEAFSRAQSAGKFFNASIKDRYGFQRDPGRRRFGPVE